MVKQEESQQTAQGELWCFSVATTAEQRVLFGTKAPEIRDQWVVTLVGTVDSRAKLVSDFLANLLLDSFSHSLVPSPLSLPR